ncbi:MAG: chemotaxis response regulator protein-glutamate methylesterase [Sneathiella sp.]
MRQLNRSLNPASMARDPYRVMVVDDSAVIRGFLTRWLNMEDDIQVVASANNGIAALRECEKFKPEIIILDIEMPEMDGMTALPQLIAMDPDLQVIMASTLTRRNADVSLRALSIGAADYIAKPESTRVNDEKDAFQHGLTEKVRVLGAARRGREETADKPVLRPTSVQPSNLQGLAKLTGAKAPIVLRATGPVLAPQIIAIGSSTGGPQALFQLFEQLKGKTNLPIVITQHMPATFTALLAEHLNKIYDKEVVEAKDGEKIVDGRVYVAPGDWHMTIQREGIDTVIRLNQEPPENFCRPSVDPMLRSLLSVYNNRVLTVILTGMGHDGLNGCQKLAEANAIVIGQDEETSVVWGMPGAVANAGVCNSVVPLQNIAASIEGYLLGRPA